MLHIFVEVVRSRNDHFAGLRAAIARDRLGRVVEVRPSDAEFDWIDKVEYTERRFLRMFYYPAIFQSLTRRLDAALAERREGEPVRVYFSDEGVWAVFWAEYRRRYRGEALRAVNVQHGFALIRPARFMRVRRLVNAISRMCTGFPCIGYGSLAGAGAEPFDLYLTYDAAAAEHIRQTSGRAAIPAPHLIKHELIVQFLRRTAGRERERPRALFAMNVKMRGSPIRCGPAETYDVLLPLARALEQLGAKLVIRFHPGMDRQVEAERYRAHPIAQHAELDESASLQDALAQSSLVMSLLSTVLWEAGLLGLVPVQVLCRCCDDVELGYERAPLRLDAGFETRLAGLVDASRAIDPANALDYEAAEWGQVKAELLATS